MGSTYEERQLPIAESMLLALSSLPDESGSKEVADMLLIDVADSAGRAALEDSALDSP
jgi:hypothetical protein